MKLINTIISKIDEFPTLPSIYIKLNEVISDTNSNAEDVAKVISQDQASVSKILKVVNSPIYGFKRDIKTISQSVVMLGFSEIKNLVLTLSILESFKEIENFKLLKPIELWKFSIATGIIAKIIAVSKGNKELERIFILGILHGIGKLLFMEMLPELYEKVITYSFENQISTRETEIKIIGMHNSTAGRLLADRWHLPTEIKDIIKYHIIGDIDGKYDENVAIIHVSTIVADMLKLGNSGEFKDRYLNVSSFNKLNLENNFFTKNLGRILTEYNEIVSLMLYNEK